MPTYKVPDGAPSVLGHKAGDQFDADIPAAQEARLIARGQLTLVGGLTQKPRNELDEMARALGLAPEQYPNKPALIEAIQAHTNAVTKEGV